MGDIRTSKVNNINKSNTCCFSKKLTCNPSSIARQQSSAVPGEFYSHWINNRYTMISRKSSIRTKHEITTIKSGKYTVNKHKINLFACPFSLSRFNNMDELFLQGVLGKFAYLARYSRACWCRDNFRAFLYILIYFHSCLHALIFKL